VKVSGSTPCFFQIRLVDARKGTHDDGRAAEVARGHRRVLAAAALTVVLVADHDPLHAGRLEITCDLRERLTDGAVSGWTPLPVSPVKALVAPRNMLSLICRGGHGSAATVPPARCGPWSSCPSS